MQSFSTVKHGLKIAASVLFSSVIIFSNVSGYAGGGIDSPTLGDLIDDQFQVEEKTTTLLDIFDNETNLYSSIDESSFNVTDFNGGDIINLVDTENGKMVEFTPRSNYIGNTAFFYEICGTVKPEFANGLPPVDGNPADPNNFCLEYIYVSISVVENTNTDEVDEEKPTEEEVLNYPTVGSYIVNTVNARLNVRDENCLLINSLSSRTEVKRLEIIAFECNIDGIAYEMMGIEYDGGVAYVAQVYTQEILGEYLDQSILTVNATIGLNIRDENCNIVTAVVDNTVLTPDQSGGNGLGICYAPRSNNGFYWMQPIVFDGGIYYVASYYVE